VISSLALIQRRAGTSIRDLLVATFNISGSALWRPRPREEQFQDSQ